MTIKEWRETRRKSQAETADELGWSQSTYHRIEAGEQPANQDQLRRLFEVSAGVLRPDDLVLGARS